MIRFLSLLTLVGPPFLIPLEVPLFTYETGNQLVKIEGSVPAEATSFTVNFVAEGTPSAPRAFYMNVNLGSEVARNSEIPNEGFGTPETGGGMPFEAGKNFEIIFIVTLRRIEAYVNGAFFFTFNHRRAIFETTHLEIIGDVVVTNVERKQDPFCDSICTKAEDTRPTGCMRGFVPAINA